MITHNELRSLVSYSPETGEFTRLKGTGKGAAKGAITKGTIDASTGYRRLCIKGRQFYAHRIAWLYMTGGWPADQIDHVNEDRSDNRFSNLREANNAQNNQRSKARTDSVTGVLGVSWHKRARKYVAQIRHQGRSIYLGLHSTIQDAQQARLVAEQAYHSHHHTKEA